MVIVSPASCVKNHCQSELGLSDLAQWLIFQVVFAHSHPFQSSGFLFGEYFKFQEEILHKSAVKFSLSLSEHFVTVDDNNLRN